MNDNTFVPGLFIGFIIGASLMWFCMDVKFDIREMETIDRGYGYYHPKTKDFTWKTNLVEKIEKVEFNK